MEAVRSGRKQVDIAKEYGIAASTLSTILKEKDKILKLSEQSVLCPDRKGLRLGNHQNIDEAVYTWFTDVRSKNIPVSGPMLQAKAKEFAEVMKVEKFDASSDGCFVSVKDME